MKLVNYSPFPHLVFESRTKTNRPFGVVVLSGAFEFSEGSVLRPASRQPPICVRDQYLAEPGHSSIIRESALAPFKPHTDIHIDAFAHAPENRPLTAWRCSLRIGELTKVVLARGVQVWQRSRDRSWSLSRPEPSTHIPITYERAYGGTCVRDELRQAYARNPLGTGWCPDHEGDDEVNAPQIVAPDHQDRPPGPIELEPQGLGPLHGSWHPRLVRAGTFDSAWRKRVAPILPEDFDWAFYNSAPSDLIYPGYVAGGELIKLENLTHYQPVVCSSVPNYGVYTIISYSSSKRRAAPLQLDTIHISLRDPDHHQHRVFLTWRGNFSYRQIPAKIEIRLRERSHG